MKYIDIDLNECIANNRQQIGESCDTYAFITFIESLIWKLTGKKYSFSIDEIMNIYIDNQQSYVPIYRGNYKYDYLIFNSYERMNARGEDGSWDNLKRQRQNEYRSMNYGSFAIGGDGFAHQYSGYKDTVLYNILHYNDEFFAKNHYPNAYSFTCEAVKNYIENNIFNIEKPKNNQIHPDILISALNSFGLPAHSGLMGQSLAHAFVLIQNKGNDFIFFDSNQSPDGNNHRQHLIYEYEYPYYTKSIQESTYHGKKHYYERDLLSVTHICTFKRFEDPSHKITLLSSEYGYIEGVHSDDSFPLNKKLCLSACPKDGYYFHEWSDGCKLNPRSDIVMSSDLSIGAIFTDYKSKNPQYFINLIDSDTSCYSVKKNPNKDVYNAYDSVSISIQLDNNYEFIKWNDGNINMNMTFEIDHNISLYPIIKHK